MGGDGRPRRPGRRPSRSSTPVARDNRRGRTGQIVGAELLLRLGRGDRAARGGPRLVLELAPLGAGVSEQEACARCWHCRTCWSPTPGRSGNARGPRTAHRWHGRNLAGRAARCRLRGQPRQIATMTWPTPGAIASNFPVGGPSNSDSTVWSTVAREGRILIAWLCGTGETPQRSVLREFGEVERPYSARLPWTRARAAAGASDATGGARPARPTPAHIEGGRDRGSGVGGVSGSGRAQPGWSCIEVASVTSGWPSPSGRSAGGQALKNLRTTLNYLHGVLEPGRATRETRRGSSVSTRTAWNSMPQPRRRPVEFEGKVLGPRRGCGARRYTEQRRCRCCSMRWPDRGALAAGLGLRMAPISSGSPFGAVAFVRPCRAASCSPRRVGLGSRSTCPRARCAPMRGTSGPPRRYKFEPVGVGSVTRPPRSRWPSMPPRVPVGDLSGGRRSRRGGTISSWRT